MVGMTAAYSNRRRKPEGGRARVRRIFGLRGMALRPPRSICLALALLCWPARGERHGVPAPRRPDLNRESRWTATSWKPSTSRKPTELGHRGRSSSAPMASSDGAPRGTMKHPRQRSQAVSLRYSAGKRHSYRRRHHGSRHGRRQDRLPHQDRNARASFVPQRFGRIEPRGPLRRQDAEKQADGAGDSEGHCDRGQRNRDPHIR